MRQFAIVLPLVLLASCNSLAWEGRGKDVSHLDDRSVDIARLADDYQEQAFYRSVRQRKDGRANAFGRGLENITDFVDRHMFNYNPDDPTVNYPTSSTMLDHTFGFVLTNTAGRLPIIDDSTR